MSRVWWKHYLAVDDEALVHATILLCDRVDPKRRGVVTDVPAVFEPVDPFHWVPPVFAPEGCWTTVINYLVLRFHVNGERS